MSPPRVERFARTLSPLRVASVRTATTAKTALRSKALEASLGENWEESRAFAAEVKDAVLSNLKTYLLQFEKQCLENGWHVHWAKDASSARAQILTIVANTTSQGGIIVKAKSMATEEIHLNPALEQAGYEVVETDLGEFVVQIDGDAPSHIVTPIIHKNRTEVAKSFAREGLGPYTEEPTELTMQARAHLREKFRKAEVGISGVNFAIAETGRIVLVENEGNNRLSTTAPRVHIAVMGIEKILPNEAVLPTFLKLLAASATNQYVTTYTHFISGPRKSDETDGPEEAHLVLLDNGRSNVLSGPYESVLRCIRCGACQNACPVYRQTSGHAYGHVYGGPIGAVLAPALEGVAKQGELSKASSLCGLCEEVCPVKIPIPDMLLRLRSQYVQQGGDAGGPWRFFVTGATRPWMWRFGLRFVGLLRAFPFLAKGWTAKRSAPRKHGREFRRWMNGR